MGRLDDLPSGKLCGRDVSQGKHMVYVTGGVIQLYVHTYRALRMPEIYKPHNINHRWCYLVTIIISLTHTHYPTII